MGENFLIPHVYFYTAVDRHFKRGPQSPLRHCVLKPAPLSGALEWHLLLHPVTVHVKGISCPGDVVISLGLGMNKRGQWPEFLLLQATLWRWRYRLGLCMANAWPKDFPHKVLAWPVQGQHWHFPAGQDLPPALTNRLLCHKMWKLCFLLLDIWWLQANPGMSIRKWKNPKLVSGWSGAAESIDPQTGRSAMLYHLEKSPQQSCRQFAD